MSALGWAGMFVEGAKLVVDIVRAATSGDRDAIVRARRGLRDEAKAKAEAAGRAAAMYGAIVEAADAGVKIYKDVRDGHDVTVVRAPRGLAERAKAEAERRQKKGAGR